MNEHIDIVIPPTPDDSDPRIVMRFAVALHAVSERILQEVRTNRDEVLSLKRTVEPKHPDRGLRHYVDENMRDIADLKCKVAQLRDQREQLMRYLIGIGIMSFIGLLSFLGKHIFEAVIK